MALREKPYLEQVFVDRAAVPSMNGYPFNIPAVRNLDGLAFHPDVTFFVGENGSGKSTVLEAIALALGFGPDGGTKNVLFQTAETISPLHHLLKLSRNYRSPQDHYFLRAETFYNVASYMDEVGVLDGHGGVSLHHRSHGEAFMDILTNKLRGRGLYLFDEPEAALSPQRQLAALRAIHFLVEDASQFIIATHSPILLSYPSAKIIAFDSDGLREVAYEDTEHFSITRDFLNHYQRWLPKLFQDDDEHEP